MYKDDYETQIRHRLDGYGDMLRIQDVADILDISFKNTQKKIATEQIKSMLIGQIRYIAKEWLTEYLDSGEVIIARGERLQTKRDKIVEFCHQPRSRQEIQEYFGYSTDKYMRKILTILVNQGRLAYTEKPHHRNQKYIARVNQG